VATVLDQFIRVGSWPRSALLDQTCNCVDVDRTQLAKSRIRLDRLKQASRIRGIDS